MRKICGKVYVETWKSDRDGHQRERKIHCTLPPGHVPGHGWELDRATPDSPPRGFRDLDEWWDCWIVMWSCIGLQRRYPAAFANHDWPL